MRSLSADLGLQSCDIIGPMHCLICQRIVAKLGCQPGIFKATCKCLLFSGLPNLVL